VEVVVTSRDMHVWSDPLGNGRLAGDNRFAALTDPFNGNLSKYVNNTCIMVKRYPLLLSFFLIEEKLVGYEK
jgi:hypothetical protein